MSEGIKRMLAEREMVAATNEANSRRLIWNRIGAPRERAYRRGFDLIRRYQAGEPLDPISYALAEGMEIGMMDGILASSKEGWNHSDSRRAAIQEAEAAAEALA